MTYWVTTFKSADDAVVTAEINKAEGEGWTLQQLIWAEHAYTAVFHQKGAPRGRRAPTKRPERAT